MYKKSLLISFLCIYTSCVNAGQVADWFRYGINQINKPLIEALDIYRSEGFILIDVSNDYAAFSYNAQRLEKDQRERIGSVEATKALTISFNSCPNKSGFLSGDIHTITVKRNFSGESTAERVMNEFTEDLRSLVAEFDLKPGYTKRGFGASKNKSDQVFMSWKSANDLLIEIQINSKPHQLVAVASKQCS